LVETLRPLGASRGLPACAYLDPKVLDWERQHLFQGGWTCAGRAPVGPAQQVARMAGGTGVLLVRDENDRVHAFANVCRHRGHELLECGAAADRAVIQCPYHAWSYELDGALRVAPGMTDWGPFDPDDFGLVPLRRADWGGWVFVNTDGRAGSFDAHLGALKAILAPWEPESLVPLVTRAYDVAANWKLVHENFHECYHCPLIHPELCRVSPPASGDNFDPDGAGWLGGTMALDERATTMSLNGAGGAPPRPGLDAQQRRRVVYVGLGPDVLISAHPDYVLTHQLTPLAPDRTRVECQWLFATGASFDPAYAVDFWDVTNRQDWAAIESVQRGLSSPAYVPGIFTPREDAVHRFVTGIARAYTGGGSLRFLERNSS
jgi:Rieske 2Fe-2S family protein